MDIQYFSDFSLGGTKLSSFNGIKYNPSGDGIPYDISMPSPEHTTVKIPNTHGEKWFKTTYGTRLISVPVFIYDTLDIDRFNAWVSDCNPRPFYFVNSKGESDYKEIDVIYSKGIDITQYYSPDFKGTTTLEFIAHYPLWRVRNEKNIEIKFPTINKENKFNTKTTIESLPLIKITPNGTQSKIIFQFNDIIITLSNVNKDIYIDSFNGEVYEENNGIKVGCFEKYYSNGWIEFPKINPFVYNKLILIEGNVASFEITPNSRIV